MFSNSVKLIRYKKWIRDKKHRDIKIPQVREERIQLSSLKLSCAFYSKNVFMLKIIRYNHCCLWIQMYLCTDVLFVINLYSRGWRVSLCLPEIYYAHQSWDDGSWKSLPAPPAPAGTISIKQEEGETHKEKENVEVSFLPSSLSGRGNEIGGHS